MLKRKQTRSMKQLVRAAASLEHWLTFGSICGGSLTTLATTLTTGRARSNTTCTTRNSAPH